MPIQVYLLNWRYLQELRQRTFLKLLHLLWPTESAVTSSSTATLDTQDSPNETVPEVGSEVVIAGRQARPRSTIDVNHPRFQDTMKQWLQIESDLDSDDDNDQVEPEPLDVDYLRTDEDLTPEQRQILQAEDNANDVVLREVLSSSAFTFEWSKERSTFKGKREIFTGTPGPTFDLSNLQPTDILEKMFNTTFIDMLVSETNKYAAQKLLYIEDMSAKCRLRQWKETDRAEMISFLSLIYKVYTPSKTRNLIFRLTASALCPIHRGSCPTIGIFYLNQCSISLMTPYSRLTPHQNLKKSSL